MKVFKFIFVFIIIASCNDHVPVPVSLDLENWNKSTSVSVEKELITLEDNQYKLYAKSFSNAILLRRELITNKLDSLFNIGKVRKIEVIENYHSGVASFYTIYLKINNSENIFLIKVHGEASISVEQYDNFSSRFLLEKEKICKEVSYPNNIFFQRIDSYTEFSVSNSITKVIKSCFGFESTEIN